MLYEVLYTIHRRERHQTFVEAGSAEEAMREAQALADEAGGWEHMGAWVATESESVDPDSVLVRDSGIEGFAVGAGT